MHPHGGAPYSPPLIRSNGLQLGTASDTLYSRGVEGNLSQETKPKLAGERRSHFRGRSRPGRRVDVGYQRVDGRATANGLTRATAVTSNIGVGGAFLLTESPEEIGSLLEISLRVPDHSGEILVEGEVRWLGMNDAESGGGMGLKFGDLDVSALLILRNYFSGLGK